MRKQQSNTKFDLQKLSTDLTSKTTQSKEKNYLYQRSTTRHGLLATSTTKSEFSTSSIRSIDQIQVDKSASHCSLIDTCLKERVEKYLNKEKVRCETKTNLNKLQQITDDVKSLTKQLQRSIEINKNNNSSSITLDERLLGEICYQLERRILNLIFSPSTQFYGYSLRYLSLIIKHEQNEQQRSIYDKRFQQIEKYLQQVKFHFHYHSTLTFALINRYGIYLDYQWLHRHAHLLSNIHEIQSLCQSMFSSDFYPDLDILLHSLELISNFDGKPFFYW